MSSFPQYKESLPDSEDKGSRDSALVILFESLEPDTLEFSPSIGLAHGHQALTKSA
jgi:hypothetical protein